MSLINAILGIMYKESSRLFMYVCLYTFHISFILYFCYAKANGVTARSFHTVFCLCQYWCGNSLIFKTMYTYTVKYRIEKPTSSTNASTRIMLHSDSESEAIAALRVRVQWAEMRMSSFSLQEEIPE